MKREDNTVYVASLSYGKDSIAMLEAIKQLGYPLDAIVHAEVWATDTIPADLPPMVNFKEYADKKIKEMYGIDVLHTCAMRERVTNQDSAHCLNEEQETSNTKASVLDSHCKDTLGATPTSKQIIYEKRTYEKLFYHIPKRKNGGGGGTRIPNVAGQLVYPAQTTGFSKTALAQGGKINIVQYLGIACDEPERIERHQVKKGIVLPLVDIGWDEAYCRKWCEEHDLLSPIYKTSLRGGCWFCHNQNMEQLRHLKHNYPYYWQLLMKWDNDSPTTFKPDGHTVHDIDLRIQLEDKGVIPKDRTFRWKMIDDFLNGEPVQLNLFKEI